MKTLFDELIELGYKYEMKRLANESLSSEDRNKAIEIYQEAVKLGVSQGCINSCIVEGEFKAKKEMK